MKVRDTISTRNFRGMSMKAFMWAIVACFGISIAAGFVLTAQNDSQHATRTAESVRLN
jgi:hypothetical protein